MLRYGSRFFLLMITISVLITTSSANATQLPMTGGNEVSPSNFDLRFMRLMRQWGIPGASIAIMRHGNVIATRGYGWSSLNPRANVQPNTTFRIASVSKTLTSVAVLKLVQQHRIRLDDRVFDILNDLKPLHGGSINPRLYQIKVRDLLNMSSGWYTEGPGRLDPMFGPWSQRAFTQLNGSIPPTCVAATRLMMGRPLEFRPGTQFSYSNLNYCMLGLIVSKVTQNNYSATGYASFVRNQILIPAGMTSTRLGSTNYQKRNLSETRYFNADPGRVNVDGLPYSNSGIIEKNYADGGWTSSALDLAKFLQSLSHYKILTPNVLHTMLGSPAFVRKPNTYFSMGWVVQKLNGHWYWSKHGSFTGTTAQIMQKDDGTSYVALFNTQPARKVQFFAQVQRLLATYPASVVE